MNIEHIKIGPFDYKIKYSENIKLNGIEANGIIDTEAIDISIDSSISNQRQCQCILHEAIHALDDLYDIGLNEKKTDLLASAIYMLIADNPELIAALGL